MSQTRLVYLSAFVAVSLIGCSDKQSPPQRAKQAAASEQLRPGYHKIQTSYAYKDESWAFDDIPSEAEVKTETGALLAVGKIVSSPAKPGGSITEFTVEEIHYDLHGSGRVVYKGRIVFSWPSASRPATPEDFDTPRGCARAVTKIRIDGAKEREMFPYWPMGE